MAEWGSFRSSVWLGRMFPCVLHLECLKRRKGGTNKLATRKLTFLVVGRFCLRFKIGAGARAPVANFPINICFQGEEARRLPCRTSGRACRVRGQRLLVIPRPSQRRFRPFKLRHNRAAGLFILLHINSHAIHPQWSALWPRIRRRGVPFPSSMLRFWRRAMEGEFLSRTFSIFYS